MQQPDRPTSSIKIAANVFHDLRQQILRGALAPGERLPGERELAQKYHTNRNTLREAVRRLEQSRLVTVRHGQGVTVADFRKTGTMELLPAFFETAPEMGEIAHILEDILPARLLVLEFATKLAVRRADHDDLSRLKDITDLLSAAFEQGDPKVIAHGFQRWLDALIDAGHSVAIRWIANPFLEAYRDLLDRFPTLWVLEPSFPQHLNDFLKALDESDEPRAVNVLRTYYGRVDGAFMDILSGMMPERPASPGRGAAPANRAAGEPKDPLLTAAGGEQVKNGHIEPALEERSDNGQPRVRS